MMNLLKEFTQQGLQNLLYAKHHIYVSFLQVSFRSSTKIVDRKLSLILVWWVQFMDLLICLLLTPDMTGGLGFVPRY